MAHKIIRLFRVSVVLNNVVLDKAVLDNTVLEISDSQRISDY